MLKDIKQALTHAAHQFNTHAFWHSHETLEAVWLTAVDPEKTFLQGLIQSAAACHHVIHGNAKGARNLSTYALEKLKRVQPLNIFQAWMNLDDFIQAMVQLNAYFNQPQAICAEFSPQDFPTLNVL